MIGKTLGILELENEPMDIPGGLSVPGTFQFPVKRITVPGAWARNVIDGDRSVAEAYISSACRLEADGVSAIIANCGFSALFQGEVAAAVSVPVALSSLSLVPLVAGVLPAGRKVGLLTADASKLADDHFAAVGWSSGDVAVAVAGIEGSETLRQFCEPVPAVTRDLIINDVMTAVESLLKADPAVGALVFECGGFILAAETVRRETGLLVADYVSLARMLVEMSPPPGRNACLAGDTEFA